MELKHAFIETKIQEWNDLFLLNQKFMSNFIFRGQANSEWSLRTSLERLIENHHPTPSRDKALYYIYESEMIKEFKWKFPSYEKNLIPKDGELIEWLSIMQHFGAPTRLLDFSQSMYVALFMAMDNSFYDNFSIWCINKDELNLPIFQKYIEENHVNTVSQDTLDDMAYNMANGSIVNQQVRIDRIERPRYLFKVRPKMCNERISRQQGLFLVPSTVNVPFEDILKGYYNEENHFTIDIDNLKNWSCEKTLSQQAISVLKINIGKEDKLRLTKALHQMNITSETMYPGLDGLAKSVGRLREGLGDYKD